MVFAARFNALIHGGKWVAVRGSAFSASLHFSREKTEFTAAVDVASRCRLIGGGVYGREPRCGGTGMRAFV